MSEHSNMHPLLKFVKGPVTNVYFFVVVSALFLLYASSEIYSAVFSNSLSLLGDSTALTVEILTFVTIMLIDLIKSQSGCDELSYSLLIFLDVFLPMLYLAALVVIMVYIVMKASLIIDKNGEGYLAVSTTYLYLFSLSSFCFHLLNSSAFRCKCLEPNQKLKQAATPVPVPDNASESLMRDPEVEVGSSEAAAPTSAAPQETNNDDRNINPTSRPNNNYGTHSSGYDSESETNPLVSGKAFLTQLNQTLLNIVTVFGIDILRGIVVLITAIVISTTNVSSPYADAVSALIVVATMIPMFIPVVWRYCCVEPK